MASGMAMGLAGELSTKAEMVNQARRPPTGAVLALAERGREILRLQEVRDKEMAELHLLVVGLLEVLTGAPVAKSEIMESNPPAVAPPMCDGVLGEVDNLLMGAIFGSGRGLEQIASLRTRVYNLRNLLLGDQPTPPVPQQMPGGYR